jgi:hypothetical protein
VYLTSEGHPEKTHALAKTKVFPHLEAREYRIQRTN